VKLARKLILLVVIAVSAQIALEVVVSVGRLARHPERASCYDFDANGVLEEHADERPVFAVSRWLAESIVGVPLSPAGI
jgi:hypothetical protein